MIPIGASYLKRMTFGEVSSAAQAWGSPTSTDCPVAMGMGMANAAMKINATASVTSTGTVPGRDRR